MSLWKQATYHMVAVQWDTVRKVHWARNMSEALEWAACYPEGSTVLIGKRGKLLAARF